MAERSDRVIQDQTFSSRKAANYLFLTTLNRRETRGNLVPIHEISFRQNLQYLDGLTSTFEVITFISIKDMPIRKHAVETMQIAFFSREKLEKIFS